MVASTNKVEKSGTLSGTKQPATQEADRWLNLDELRQYHPAHPAAKTIYAWVAQRRIPNYKQGQRVVFLKSEIDAWLLSGKRKTSAEILAELQEVVTNLGRTPR